MTKRKRTTVAILLATFMILSVGMGASMVRAEIPVAPHRVYGDVTYADDTPAANVTVNFVNDAGEVVASDLTDGNGFYDTDGPPGLETNIPEPADETLDIYVGDWYSGKILQWESGKSERIDITGAPVPNQPPSANFSYSPTSPTTEDTVQFTDQSSDPDGTVVAWSWAFGDGGTSTAQNPTHKYADDRKYTVTLTVTDDDGATDSVSKDITVSAPPAPPLPPPVNQPPIADAGGPYSVDEGETVELDGTGSSDPDGDALTYSWTITDDPTGQGSLTDADTSTPTFHAPSVDSATDVTVELTVDDGHGHTDSDVATITVEPVAPPVNEPPTADADGPYSVDEGETVELDGTGGSDPDGDTLTYSWSITDDPTGQGSLTDADTSTPTFHAPSVDSDTDVTVKLIVDDGHGHTDSDTATVTVNAVAPPPAEFPWPAVVAIVIVIVVVAIWCWKREEISRRLRKVLKK